MQARTSIAVTKATRDKLASFGNKDTTFEDIILQLFKRCETQKEVQKK